VASGNSRLIELIIDVKAELDSRALGWWLFGGWGLDAQLGEVTRNHGDIEFWTERSDADLVRDALLAIGAQLVGTQPVEESREFVRNGVSFSSAFFDCNDDGTFGVQGRWSDWIFPPGSFGDSTGTLQGHTVPTMSAEGMLAMKEQYASLRNGGPLRDKDVRDIAVLQTLIDQPKPNHS